MKALKNLFKSAATRQLEAINAEKEWVKKTIIRVVEHYTDNCDQQGSGGFGYKEFKDANGKEFAEQSHYVDLGLATPGSSTWTLWYRLGYAAPQILTNEDWYKLVCLIVKYGQYDKQRDAIRIEVRHDHGDGLVTIYPHTRKGSEYASQYPVGVII
jgi:hypothetical protein